MDFHSPNEQNPYPTSSSASPPSHEHHVHPQSLVPGGSPSHIPTNNNIYPAVWPRPAYRQPLIDDDNLPELVRQPPSYFHHDDKTDQDENTQQRSGLSGRQTSTSSTRERLSQVLPSTRRNRHIVYILVPLLMLVVVGAVLGGLFGSGVLEHTSSSPDGSPQDHSLDGEADVQIRASSQLAAVVVGTSVSSFTLVLFQDADGELAAIEWQGSRGDVYLVRNRFGDAKPPKPMEHSPFHAVTHGASGDLHVFYFDDAMRLAHIIRRARNKEPVSWERGSLTIRTEPAFVPSSTLRLSVTSFSSKWKGIKDDCIVLAYHTEAGNDSMAIVSSTQPDDAQSWKTLSFSLGAERLGLQLHHESPGLLVLPIARGDDAGLRMIWDLDNATHKTTFGILDCTFTKAQALQDCATLSNEWKDSAAEEEVLEMAKPLRLAALPLETKDSSSSSTPTDRYIIRVLDSQGALTELLWDDRSWTGHLPLTNETISLPEDAPPVNFTSIASADDSLLYAVSEGKLLEFSRETAWWTELSKESKEEPAWKLLDQVQTKLSKN